MAHPHSQTQTPTPSKPAEMTFEAWERKSVRPTPGKFEVGYNFMRMYEHIRRHPDFAGAFVLEGGSRSGKTFDTIRFLYVWAHSEPAPKGDFVITREKFTFLRATVYNDFITFLKSIRAYRQQDHNKTDKSIRVRDVVFHFLGADQSERFMGMSPIGVWVNEALPNFSKDAFDELDQRCSGFKILDYNPKLLKFWVYDKVIPRPDSVHIMSNILMNYYAPPQVARRIFQYEPTPENIANGTANRLKWEIYGLGLRGGFEGLVFKNWVELDTRPHGTRLLGYGLDFGFQNDQTALVAVYEIGQRTAAKRTLFVETLIYETGLFSQDIDRLAREQGVRFLHKYVVADKEKRVVQELARMNWLIIEADKGPNSRITSVDKLQGFDVCYLKGDPIGEEITTYSYLPDPHDDTRFSNKITDGNDHAIDALKYFVAKIL